MSQYMHFMLNDKQAEHLDRLVATGLYGTNLDEVLATLVGIGIREALADGLIPFVEVAVADVVFEHPPEAPNVREPLVKEPELAPKPAGQCGHGLSDEDCGAFGCIGQEIPF